MSLLFNMLSRFVIAFHFFFFFYSFSSKEQASLNFMAAITVRSDFEAQENNAIVHLVDYNVTYTCIWKPKNSCDSLYCDICFIAVN